MKRLLPAGHFLTLILGAMAIVLRLVMLLEGTDFDGLYPRNHPAWIAVCILAAAALVFFFFLSRCADRNRPYRANFPASTLGACGFLAGSIGIICASVMEWQEPMGIAAGVVGLCASAAMILGGWMRKEGLIPPFFVNMLPCLYFALRIFSMGRILGAEPEMSRYLFRFFAVLASLMASYHLWGFTVGLGNRRQSIFWSLTAVFLCLAAIPGSEDEFLYLGTALWLVTNICALAPARRIPVEEPEAPQIDLPLEGYAVVDAEELTRQEDAFQEEAAPADEPELLQQNMDADDLIAWLLQDLDTEEE